MRRQPLRVKKAGFDGVEMHMAHYALVNAFLSRIQNKRHDEYGCDTLENRARFSIEILQRVRELCGPDFVVGVRMSTKEWGHELGTTVEEACQFARMFEKAGCDYIQASNYGYGAFALAAIPEMVLYPEIPEEVKPYAERKSTGYIIPEAAEIKKAVSIPVSGVGRLDADIGEKVIAEGKVDLVCLGRRLFADPELPNKVKEGRKHSVKPCLGCLYCLHVMLFNQPVACRVNPFMGRELEMEIKPAEKKKKVVVVGAGPAGMEAARVAALRGHQVSLYDRAKELGGLLPMASFIKGKTPDDLDELLDYYKKQFDDLGVKVELGKEVTPQMLEKVQADVVILAVGGKPIPPQIPCDEKKLVTTEELKAKSKDFVRLLGADWMNALTKIFLPVGNKVVVVGADLAGLEAAEFLVKRGKQVTVVDEAEQPGEGMLIQWLIKLMPWLAAKGVQVLTGVKYEEITADGMVISTKEGERKVLSADTVMWVNKYTKNDALYKALQGKVSEVYLVGDGKEEKPAYIHGAILDGAKVAISI
ncbi:MAG: FAD-dependent oxidoreductase [Anaerolineae bacterium]|nr:FAD-dependent oxidoreductase [Anaerolineae bacterium]